MVKTVSWMSTLTTGDIEKWRSPEFSICICRNQIEIRGIHADLRESETLTAVLRMRCSCLVTFAFTYFYIFIWIPVARRKKKKHKGLHHICFCRKYAVQSACSCAQWVLGKWTVWVDGLSALLVFALCGSQKIFMSVSEKLLCFQGDRGPKGICGGDGPKGEKVSLWGRETGNGRKKRNKDVKMNGGVV